MMPRLASIAAWALEPAMSCAYKRRSKRMEALIASISASGPAAKRPPHIRLAELDLVFLRFIRHSAAWTRRLAAAGLAFALAAGLGTVPAAQAGDPPAFHGAAGQFMLIRPIKKAPFAAVDDEKGKPVDL